MYLVAATHKRIDIWDHQSERHLVTLAPAGGIYPYSYCLSNDGRMLAVINGGCNKVIIWDISDTGDCKEISESLASSCWLGEQMYDACFMSNSEHILVQYCSKVCMYNVRTGSCLHNIDDEMTFVHGLHDGAVTVSRNGVLQEWDDTLTEVRRQNLGVMAHCACISYMEDTVAVATTDIIVIVDLATWTSRKMVSEVSCWFLQFSVDGSKILVRQVNSFEYLIFDIVSEAVLSEFTFDGWACFTIDSNGIYGSYSYDGRIVCYDAETISAVPCPFVAPGPTSVGRYERLSLFSPSVGILM
jgi:WD40 repeat protein